MAIVKTRFGISEKAQIPQGQPTWTLRPGMPMPGLLKRLLKPMPGLLLTMPGLLSRQLDGRARRSHITVHMGGMHVCLGRRCMPACKPEGLREEAVRVAVVAPGPLPSGICFRRLIAVHLRCISSDCNSELVKSLFFVVLLMLTFY